MEANRPLLGTELKNLAEIANAVHKNAHSIDAQAMSPGAVQAHLECYVEIQRLVNDATASILRAHPELSEGRHP